MRKMGFCIAPTLPQGTADVQWLAHAGKEELIVITQDGRVATNVAEKQAIIDNNVRCFILPARVKKAWDMVRGFVAMWDKIRIETRFSGPFIWKFNDESHAVRWEQLYPQAKDFAFIDLSRTPIGHLLNLFADVVSMHDKGWFNESFINGLHDNIRIELEARLTGDRSKLNALSEKDNEGWESALDLELGPNEKTTREFTLAKPVDLARIWLRDSAEERQVNPKGVSSNSSG